MFIPRQKSKQPALSRHLLKRRKLSVASKNLSRETVYVPRLIKINQLQATLSGAIKSANST